MCVRVSYQEEKDMPFICYRDLGLDHFHFEAFEFTLNIFLSRPCILDAYIYNV